MNTKELTPQTLDDVYYSVAEEIELSVVPFIFHHPNIERINLPIANGGYSSKVFEDEYRWGKVATVEFSSGHSEEQQMERQVEIYPLFLANPYTIIEREGERLYMRKPLFISAQDVPAPWRVRTARALVFVLADDPQMRLCAVTFKSFNSDRIRRIYAEHQRSCASATESSYGRPVHSAFVRAVLGVGGLEKVGPRDSGRNAVLIAHPSLAIARRDDNIALAEKPRAQKIAEYLQMDQLKFYPFCLSETLAREVNMLPWQTVVAEPRSVIAPALPAANEPRALTPADLL